MRLLLSIFLLASLTSFAATKHLRPGASGTGSGDNWTDAYTTAAALAAGLGRGDVGYVAAGTCGSATFNVAASGSTWIVIKRATVAEHGSETGWDNSYATGQAVWGDVQFTDTSYYIWDGITGATWATTGHGFKVDGFPGGEHVIVNNSTNIIIAHCEVQGSADNMVGEDGFQIYFTTSDVTISNCYVYDSGNCPVQTVTAINFRFHHNRTGKFYSDEAVHGEILSATSPTVNMYWAHNLHTYIVSSGGVQIDTAVDGSAEVAGNVFAEGFVDGVWVGNQGCIGGWTGANLEKYRNVNVHNNTFVNVTIPVLGTAPTNFTANIAKNNVFDNCDQEVSFDKYATHGWNHYANMAATPGDDDASTSTGTYFVNAAGLDFTPIVGNLGDAVFIDAFGNSGSFKGALQRTRTRLVVGTLRVNRLIQSP